jgi:hypothetical protein
MIYLIAMIGSNNIYRHRNLFVATFVRLIGLRFEITFRATERESQGMPARP